MFQVKSVVDDLALKDGKVYDVYKVEWSAWWDGADTIFLIYGEDKKWHWIKAECFVPLEDSMDENWWD